MPLSFYWIHVLDLVIANAVSESPHATYWFNCLPVVKETGSHQSGPRNPPRTWCPQKPFWSPSCRVPPGSSGESWSSWLFHIDPNPTVSDEGRQGLRKQQTALSERHHLAGRLWNKAGALLFIQLWQPWSITLLRAYSLKMTKRSWNRNSLFHSRFIVHVVKIHYQHNEWIYRFTV